MRDDRALHESQEDAHASLGLPEPPWLQGRSSRRPRSRAPLGREEIVTAALRLLRKEGFGALTMRRLAEELGAGGTSAYWYVRDKGQLVDLVIDRLVGEMQVPGRGEWSERLTGFARHARRVLLDHPGAAALIVERSASGPQAILLAEALLGVLREGGVEPGRLWDAYHSLLTYVTGYVLGEEWRRPGAVTQRAPAMLDWLASLPEARFPNLRGALREPISDSEGRFAFGLACLIDGLKAQAASRSVAPRSGGLK